MSGDRASAYFRLHPSLQHAIRHDLGWRSLRPVQEQAIDAVLDGSNAVILAPTAGGKTEASIFPVLSRMLAENAPPVAVLYICPIRALLNNQEARLQRYARMVGLEAFKWHGDVGAAQKDAFRRAPAHVLMTTPESIEVMLVSQRTDTASLFRGLRAVIVDEVHAFAADDRGAHLVALLERLSRFGVGPEGEGIGDVQRIGLSATVGNPDSIGRWLQGSSQRPLRLIDPERDPADRALSVDMVDGVVGAAASAVRIARGHKALIFADSRRATEAIAGAMQGSRIPVFVHHGSVSRHDRQMAERQFAEASETAIVCTSTLELGIDVGDLDRVVQFEAPATVSSVLQRMGRTGRRPGTRPHFAFLCSKPASVLQAVAICRLMEEAWVEDVRPLYAAAHVLAHQILALALQQGGISRHRILGWVSGAQAFADLDAADATALVETMLEREILSENDGRLWLGPEGERRYGRRNFLALYAVFDTPPVFRVRHGSWDVGSLDLNFLQLLFEDEGPARFRLAGRAWAVREIDWRRGICYVQPAERGRVPTWLGGGGTLSFELCQAMKAALHDTARERDPWVTNAAAAEMASLRAGYHGLTAPGRAVIELGEGRAQWHTFAGGRINRLLAEGLRQLDGGDWRVGNLSLKTEDPEEAATAPRLIRSLATEVDWAAAAGVVAASARTGSLGKFEPCLPERLVRRLLAERLVDVPGTERFLTEQRVSVVSTNSARRRSE